MNVDQIGLVLDETNFYAEQGGQTCDTGCMSGLHAGALDMSLESVVRRGPYVLHVGVLQVSVYYNFILHISYISMDFEYERKVTTNKLYEYYDLTIVLDYQDLNVSCCVMSVRVAS